METHPARIKILDVWIDNVTSDEALQRISELMMSEHGSMVATVNPEFLMEARRNSEFRKTLNDAALRVPDGFGLRLLCWLFGARVKERVAGADLLVRLCDFATKNQKRVFLFGAMKGIAGAAAQQLRQRFPNLVVAGAENEFEPDGRERSEEEVLERMNKTFPDILFVALGAPRQELWIKRNLTKLPTVKLAMGVGGSFEYLSGDLRRAPSFFRRSGLEWLWRLLLQPSRWRRIVTAVVVFPWTILSTKKAITTEDS